MRRDIISLMPLYKPSLLLKIHLEDKHMEDLFQSFFILNHIPTNVVANHHFLNIIDVAQCVGYGVLPPTPRKILGKYLDIFIFETKEKIKILKPIGEEYGCSSLHDGWLGPTKMSIINFMVYSAGEIVFLIQLLPLEKKRIIDI